MTFNTNFDIKRFRNIKIFKKKCSVVLIISDKSYKNLEIKRGYKETDLIGGMTRI